MIAGRKSIFNLSNVGPILRGRIPGQLVIQYTDNCNATCPQCSMRKTNKYPRYKLDDKEVYKIIDAAAGKNIQALSFTGGEPFMYMDELIKLLKYASESGIPFIRTGTNGFFLTNWDGCDFTDRIHRLAEQLAQTNLRNLWISIDSADAKTHEQMRGLPGVIKGIEKALPIFHEHGIYPAANLGINRNLGGAGRIPVKVTNEEEFKGNFEESFTMFYQFIINLGFTMTNSCYPMSVDENKTQDLSTVYGATSDSSVICFSSREKIQIFKALLETVPKFRSEIRIFTPLVSLYSLIKQYEGAEEYALPCRGGIDFFFVEAKGGDTYPCGYRGHENLGKFYDLNLQSLKVNPYCRLCDWECFRDPSEQIGYLIEKMKSPFTSRKKKDPLYQKLWNQDLKYYRKCHYFDGRIGIK